MRTYGGMNLFVMSYQGTVSQKKHSWCLTITFHSAAAPIFADRAIKFVSYVHTALMVLQLGCCIEGICTDTPSFVGFLAHEAILAFVYRRDMRL